MTEKPTLDKVTLVPDQHLTEQEKEACIHYLISYEPRIIWEVGQKVNAYIETKIINLYIRSIDPRTLFIGTLAEDGVINIVEHQEIGEINTLEDEDGVPPPHTRPRIESAGEPILTVNRVPPNVEIEIKIKKTAE